MITKYYDVVVLGMEVGPLTAGALLAKRGFRVLVVGQNAPSDKYDCLGFKFIRRPFMMPSAESPAIRRVISELGAGQILSHMIRTISPVYQVILPRARVNVESDHELTIAELSREFPDDAGDAEQIFSNIGRLSGEIDKLFANDMVVPPETFFEKREFARAEVQNPFKFSNDADFLNKPCQNDSFREFFDAVVRFETGCPSVSASCSPLSPLIRMILSASPNLPPVEFPSHMLYIVIGQ